MLMHTGGKPIASKIICSPPSRGGSAVVRSTRLKAASSSRARSCNGSATAWASLNLPAKSKRSRRRCRTTAGCISCRPLPVSVRRIGTPMRAGSSSASRAKPRAHRPRPRRHRVSSCRRPPGDGKRRRHPPQGTPRGRRRVREQSAQAPFQAGLLGVPVVRPRVAETTALGAARPGLGVGFWKDRREIAAHWEVGRPSPPPRNRPRENNSMAGWSRALARAKNWSPPQSGIRLRHEPR